MTDVSELSEDGRGGGSLLTERLPKYSIIVVNYNGGQLLLNCLESVFQHTNDFELILVDNNSSDHSVPQAVARFPQIALVRNETNLGFANANNGGLRRVRGQWIVLLNPDTLVTNNWLDHLVQSGVSSGAGIVAPKLLRLDGQTIDSTGLVFDLKTGLSHDRGSGAADRGQFDQEELIPCCGFACAAIRREVIHMIGVLDQKMILYFEDIDYCIRARIAGWPILYCPRSVVLHARSGVTPRSFGRVQKWAVAYRLRIMLKCYGLRNAIRYGVLRVFHDFVSMLAGMKNNDLEYFLGYLRSPIWNLLNLPISERTLVQSTRKISDDVLFISQ